MPPSNWQTYQNWWWWSSHIVKILLLTQTSNKNWSGWCRGKERAIGERKMQEENKKINLYFSGSISIPEDFLQKEFLKTYSFSSAVALKSHSFRDSGCLHGAVSVWDTYSTAPGNRITGIQWRTMDVFGPKQMQSREILRLIKKQGERTQVKRGESRSKLEQLNEGGGKAESKVMAEEQRNTFKLDQRGLVKRSSITSNYALQVLWVTWVIGWEWTEKGD